MKFMLMVILLTMFFWQLPCWSQEDTNKSNPQLASPVLNTVQSDSLRITAEEGYALGLKMMNANQPIPAFVFLNYVANHYLTDDEGIKAAELILTMKASHFVLLQKTCSVCKGVKICPVACQNCHGTGTQPCTAVYPPRIINGTQQNLHCQGGVLYNQKNLLIYEDKNSKMICETCQGRGQIPCENCHSSGTVDETCKHCNNSGVAMEQVAKEIPAYQVYNHADYIYEYLCQQKGIKDYLTVHSIPSDNEKMLLMAAEDYLLAMVKKMLEQKDYIAAIALHSCCGEICGRDIASQLKEYQQQGIAYYLAQGESYSNSAKFEESNALYQKVLVLDKENPVALKKIQDNQTKALQHYIRRGEDMVSLANFKEAYLCYEKILAIDQGNAIALQKLQQTKALEIQYYFSRGDGDKRTNNFIAANEWYAKVFALEPDHQVALQKIKDTKQEGIQYYFKNAEQYIQTKDFIAANTWYEKALALDKENKTVLQKIKQNKEQGIDHYFSQAEKSLKAKNFKEAYSWYEKARSLDQKNQLIIQKIKEVQEKEIAHYLSEGDANAKKNFDTATYFYKKALALAPENQAIVQKIAHAKQKAIQQYMNEGDQSLRSKDFKQAYKSYEKAHKLDRENQALIKKLEDIKKQAIQHCISMGDKMLKKDQFEARIWYMEVLTWDKDNKIARQKLDDLNIQRLKDKKK